MIQYSEQASSSAGIYENDVVVEHAVARDKVSLSQIWQYLTRMKCLPDGLDLDIFFATIHQKLNDPEWEVRQHTLRLLRDFIKNVDNSCVNNKTENIFEDLLHNLGHISPAVRKAAADCLRTHLKQNQNADEILKSLFERVVEKSNAQTNVVLGVILATPFLILPSITEETVLYVIRQLIGKVDEKIYREATVRSLVRLRCVIGEEKFRGFLEMGPAGMSVESLEELAAGYSFEVESQNLDFVNGNRSVWSDFNENFLEEMDDPLRSGTASDGFIEDRVILETEIQLNSGPAVTMQLHEQSRQNSFNETTDSEEEIRHNSGIVRVLTDDSEQDDDAHRRTPRRVRFGGEVVKMRTPDSDSNTTGDEKEPIKNKRHTKSAHNVRSFIPVRISGSRKSYSEPNSPQRKKKYNFYLSTPDLSKSGHVFGPKVVGVSRIPRRSDKPLIKSTIKITIDNSPKETQEKPATKITIDNNPKEAQEKPSTKITIDNSLVDEQPMTKTKVEKSDKQNLSVNTPSTHHGIEILYNLTQSPQRNSAKKTEETTAESKTNIDNKADFETELLESTEPKTNFNSFQICDVNFGSESKERNASFVRVDNSDDSENDKANPIEDIMKELQRQEDVTTRLRALKSLFKILKPSTTSLELLEDHIGQLMHLLFSASDQPALKLLAQEILSFLFENVETSLLEGKLNQIVMFLCKMGMPDGVRLAMKLMRKVSIGLLVDQLLTKPVLHAKSSKIREGGIQILISICRLCPSTDIDTTNVAKSIIFALADRKRKVRQAVLELLAVLAQLSSISHLLDIATTETQDHPERERILRALRNRLSRKQLPAVEANGLIRYSTPIGESELEWLSLGSSSEQNLYNSQSQQRIGSTSRSDLGYWERNDRFKGTAGRRGLEVHSACDIGWPRSKNFKEQENGNSNRVGIWAIETSPPTTSNQSVLNATTLRPIYVLQSNGLTNNKKIYEENAHQQNADSSSSASSRSKSISPRKIIAASNSELFKKSFSSDSLCGKQKTASVSSGCSSTSGSSTRSGNWNKEVMRSGIPVRVGSISRGSFRRNHAKADGHISHGGSFRSKASTPEKHSQPIPKPISFTEHFSSAGSESSGYFTPPAEAPHSNYSNHKPESNHEGAIPKQQTESFVRIDSPPRPSPSSPKEKQPFSIEELQKENAAPPKTAPHTPTVVEDVEESDYIVEEPFEREKTAESLDDVDFDRKINRAFSKSEADLKGANTNNARPLKSAPLYNDYSHTPVYHETTINITNVTLPGSAVDVTVQSQVKTMELQPEQKELQKKPLKRTLSRRSTKSNTPSEQSFSRPKESLSEVLNQLESNEWETTIKGLKALVRIKKQNSDALEPHMHNICVALGKQIKNLRSQVARAACTAAAEMFVDHKKSFELEVEEIAAPLLQRTADTNKFLRSDANATLDVMCATLQPPKVVAIVTSKGCTHQNALVRATSARLLCNLVHKLGADKVFQMPRETRDKILLAGANMLLDGNLDTRKSAKIMLSHLCKHAHFHKSMLEVIPTCTMRHIQKTLKSLK